jgi:hypothetical protein
VPQVVYRDDDYILFTFPGLAGNLAGSFNRRSGISISVTYEGECWDFLGDFDTIEEYSHSGYFCGLCLPETRKYYDTRKEFWEVHCFETFLQWCNETLAPANWLGLYDYDGMTEARLLLDKSEDKLNMAIIELKKGMYALDGKPFTDNPAKYKKVIIPLRR